MSESNLIENYKQTDAALVQAVSKARKNFEQDKEMGMVQGEDFLQWANSRVSDIKHLTLWKTFQADCEE